ncbi:MAG: GIY-YIG nuclease family protein [Microgenomates group bacterium]|nr:GIY-YIG nuclease family protein [Microgenomates group bacterium]
MYYVYLLKDLFDKIYIGYSCDLKKRLKDHLNKRVYTTKKMKGLKLNYYEAYRNKELAKLREKKLKQFGSAYQGLIKRLGLKK